MLGALSGHLDPVRAVIPDLLGLGDEELIDAVGGRHRAEITRKVTAFDAGKQRGRLAEGGVEAICCCDPAYPIRLRDLGSAPAVLNVVGGLARLLAVLESEPVAIVGSRAASSYGASVASSLARGLVSAGVPVISGLAAGIDLAAHHGAVLGGGATVAVLPGPAGDPYPRAATGLYRQILGRGAAISEIPPGVRVRSWMFLARNRLIAALAAMTIVVEARAGSGALLTAAHASEIGRIVGAVPGRVTQRQAAGPHDLIRGGAHLVRSTQDVLDVLFETGTRMALSDQRPELTREQRAVLTAIEEGRDTPAALLDGVSAQQRLALLASLELAGYVRRAPGGRFTVLP